MKRKNQRSVPFYVGSAETFPHIAEEENESGIVLLLCQEFCWYTIEPLEVFDGEFRWRPARDCKKDRSP